MYIIKFQGFLAYFQAIFRKVIENGYLLQKHTLNSLYHVLIVHKN